jgi:hypothetical protein
VYPQCLKQLAASVNISAKKKHHFIAAQIFDITTAPQNLGHDRRVASGVNIANQTTGGSITSGVRNQPIGRQIKSRVVWMRTGGGVGAFP